jgi:predicted lipoprotein with Yx(FWY)xxD motif
VAARSNARITPAHRVTIVIAVLATCACAVLLVLLLTGRSGNGGGASAARPRAAATPSVQLRRTKLGRILTDGGGRTLYLFDEDADGRSHCHSGCAQVWPPALVTGKVRAGAGVDPAKLTTTRRGHRERQLVYDGHPLYRLDSDTGPGQMQGEGFGGTWWVVSPTGHAIIAPGLKRSKGGY